MTLFSKIWTKGHWPLDDLWPHICWGHMCDSTQGSLYPGPIGIHQCMWIQWSILQNTTCTYYIHCTCLLHTTDRTVINEPPELRGSGKSTDSGNDVRHHCRKRCQCCSLSSHLVASTTGFNALLLPSPVNFTLHCLCASSYLDQNVIFWTKKIQILCSYKN